MSEKHQRPELIRTQDNVWALPGASEYRKHTPGGTDGEKLTQLTTDVIKEIDAKTAVRQIPWYFGWSQQKREAFFRDDKRHPFKSKLELSQNASERRAQLLTIGRYLTAHYTTTTGAEKENARKTLRSFTDSAIYDVFMQPAFSLEDEIYGVDRTGEHNRASRTIKDLIKSTAQEVAPNNPDAFDQAMTASEDGNVGTIHLYLLTHQAHPDVAAILATVIQKRLSDPELKKKKLTLSWNVHTFIREMGISWDTYLQLNLFDTSDTMSNRLEEALRDTRDITQTLQQEAPASWTKIEQGKDVQYLKDILPERARTLNLPATQEAPEALQQKTTDTRQEVLSLLVNAESDEDTPLDYAEAPTAIGATTRAQHLRYYTKDNNVVTMVVVNPRNETGKLRQSLAHEETHKEHVRVVKRENIDKTTKETLAMLVEKAIAPLFPATTDTQPASKYLNDISHRSSLEVAFVQNAVHQKMDALWNAGIRPDVLDNETLNDLIATTETEVDQHFPKGISITTTKEALIRNTRPIDLLDGLAYKRRELMPATKADNQQTRPSLQEAFEDRFGPRWLADDNAYCILLGLYAKTAQTSDMDELAAFIQNADIAEIKEQLMALGLQITRPNRI